MQTTGVHTRPARPARWRALGRLTAAAAAVAVAVPAAGSAAQAGTVMSGHSVRPSESVRYRVGHISRVSVGCPGGTGGTGDISEAVDRARHYVYTDFEGCDNGNGIGFVRSANGGRSFTRPHALPFSDGGWDPWVAVAPDGTVYASFMNTIHHRTYPIIDVSHDYGRTFHVEQSLRPAQRGNYGDADYITVAPNGTLYVAWDYGPSNAEVRQRCSPTGDCWSWAGPMNLAVQSSTDEAKTFTPISIANPGYPDGGVEEGDVTVAPDGAIDVLYQGYKIINKKIQSLAHGYEYFTTSTDDGKTWSAPVVVGASAGQMTINIWWNDGYIVTDPAGNLYATWDTQGKADGHKTDIGWVAFSPDGGRTWSAPFQATPDHKNVPHITEAVGAGPGEAYVAWVSSDDPRGYALYLRKFSIRASGGFGGWLSGAARISRQFGNPNYLDQDTFGIETFSPTSLVASWGSAIPGSRRSPSVFAAPVKVLTR
ncbi:MAG: sialidase family protein [Streptosporangiaceae bacterium]